jgi:fatty acid desaturase
MIALCYGMFAFSGLVLWPDWPIAAIALMAVAAGLHSSLQHEALHGHPTSKGWINELLVALVPLAPAYPYRRFKTLHLRHHHDERLTDPYDDPESYYLDGRAHDELGPVMRGLLNINNTLAGRMVIGPALMVAAFIGGEIKRIASGDADVIRAWALHACGLAVTGVIVQAGFGMPAWLYMLVAGYLGMSLIAIRTYCEHQAAGDPNHRTIIVERSPLSWLFLNNNLHLVHHKMPALAWYKLPEAMRARREEWLAMNNGYVFAGYRDIFRRFAFKRKEPLVHPSYPSPRVGAASAQPAE